MRLSTAERAAYNEYQEQLRIEASTETEIHNMITYKLVMPEHLNKFGDLFGGNMLKWVDEVAAMAVFIDFPEARFLTIGMDQVVFKRPVKGGAILKFVITPLKEGHTSVTYSVSVVEPNSYDNPYFTTSVTFVRVDEQMRKIPVRS